MGVLEAEWTVEIGAPRERCWEVAADVEHAPEWQRTLEEVEVIETGADGRPRVVQTVSDATVKKVHSRLRFGYDPPREISWTQEKGDVKSLDGWWELEELGPELTRATYRLRADPGRVLGLLLRGPVEGKVKELLTRGAAEGLKQRLER